MTVSAENQTLARYLASVAGGAPSVEQFWDKARKSNIDIMALADRPGPGATTYSTLGLSDFSIGLISDGVPVRAELMLTLRSVDRDAANILATCAMDVVNDKIAIRPGSILANAVHLYRPELAMKDIFLVDPFIWGMESQVFPTKKVAWLAGVPISKAERIYGHEQGREALNALLEEKRADVFNLERASVL